jgi:DNA-binding GntR family transcriptional regulator
LNTEFHRTLCRAANNALLADAVERMSQLIQWVYTRRITVRGTESWSEHRRIVDAIADGDAERASAQARAHIANARDAFLHDQESLPTASS